MHSLVIADCRCGGTNLVKTLGSHPRVKMTNIDDCQEKLAALWAAKTEPDWPVWLQEQWQQADVWHLQRYQVSRTSVGWDHILSANPRIIYLIRENVLLQYLSWKYALHTQQFHRRQKKDIRLEFDNKDFAYWSSVWKDKQLWVANKLRPLSSITITFESLQYDWHDTIASVQRFLGLEYFKLNQYMPTPVELDYHAIFGLSP